MKRAREFCGRCWQAGWGMTRAGAGSVAAHWALALFSLVTAFGVWMAIQDVENPRTRSDIEGVVDVTAVNVPDGFLVEDIEPIRIRVEAREELLAKLLPADFEATVDVKDIEPGEAATRRVRVVSEVDDVRVVSTHEVAVILVPAAEREIAVTVQRTESLPPTLEESEAPSIEPAFVTIRGPQELVDQVATVRLDVNLSGARNETETFTGDLAAYTESGQVRQVEILPEQAKVTFKIRQLVTSRQVDLFAVITGDPAAGYRVAGTTIAPATVLVTGTKAVIDGLRPPLNVEKIDITNQTKTVTMTRRVEAPANTSVQPQTVTVTIQIEAIQGSETRSVRVEPEGMPAGLQLQTGAYTALVKLSGPQDLLNNTKPEDVRVTVSFAGAVAGTAAYTPKVTAPAGVRAEVSPVTITLVPLVTP
ncbi:MAG: hypothetical protein IT303_18490 [Dehalococcoidia bacterium]|nr:hypothetical protein [Dehalococcoidia bacterium]